MMWLLTFWNARKESKLFERLHAVSDSISLSLWQVKFDFGLDLRRDYLRHHSAKVKIPSCQSKLFCTVLPRSVGVTNTTISELVLSSYAKAIDQYSRCFDSLGQPNRIVFFESAGQRPGHRVFSNSLGHILPSECNVDDARRTMNASRTQKHWISHRNPALAGQLNANLLSRNNPENDLVYTKCDAP